MPEHVDLIYFHKGLNTLKDALHLEDGELTKAEGLNFSNPGITETLDKREIVSSAAISSIHTLYRYLNWLIACAGSNLYYQWDMDGYCNQYVHPDRNWTLAGSIGSSKAFTTVGYQDFIFLANGINNKAFEKGNIHNWKFENPLSAPTIAAGAAGNPTGTQTAYYTYLYRFSNGHQVESAPSPASAAVAFASEIISWTGISVCPKVPTGAVVWRNLYRYSTGIGGINYVTSIENNTATTYSDDIADATVTAAAAVTTEDYAPFPDSLVSMELHLNRMFGIKENKLWWSEPYLPFQTKLANNIAVCPNDEKLMAIVEYADTLYFASQKTWYKLSGTDPTTWSVKPTYADVGVVATNTVKKTKFGILSVWYDGVYLFNGVVTKSISKNKLSGNDYWSYTEYGDTTKETAVAEFDGETYSLYVGSSPTAYRTGLNINMKFYPDFILSDDHLVFTALRFHPSSNKYYFGKSDGFLYYLNPVAGDSLSTDTKYLKIETKAFTGGNAIKQKCAKYLYYDIYTNNKDVSIYIYVDSINNTVTDSDLKKYYTTTINSGAATRKRGRIELPDLEGYNFAIEIINTRASGIAIFEPWALHYTLVGD